MLILNHIKHKLIAGNLSPLIQNMGNITNLHNWWSNNEEVECSTSGMSFPLTTFSWAQQWLSLLESYQWVCVSQWYVRQLFASSACICVLICLYIYIFIYLYTLMYYAVICYTNVKLICLSLGQSVWLSVSCLSSVCHSGSHSVCSV